MVAHVGALHDHVHVVQVGKDRILQALTVVGADRFQNIRVLLNDRFFCLMMDGEQTCPAIMYILWTGMLQHELPVGQRIEDIIYIHPESELIPSATLELIQLEGKKTGLILNPCTSLETVKDMLPITDYVMIMAVNPGFAGREFMPYTRQKFIELDNYRKEKGLNYHLMLDGGATREVIADLYHNCNVEGFVLGKQELFFQQDDYATCIDRIRTF